jgi:replicative DNA helicase
MADFKNSSSIEACADLAMIFRNIDPSQTYKSVRLVDGFLVKQRVGPHGKIPYKFDAVHGEYIEIPGHATEQEAA